MIQLETLVVTLSLQQPSKQEYLELLLVLLLIRVILVDHKIQPILKPIVIHLVVS